jgi:hypothetical protein
VSAEPAALRALADALEAWVNALRRAAAQLAEAFRRIAACFRPIRLIRSPVVHDPAELRRRRAVDRTLRIRDRRAARRRRRHTAPAPA